jgi:hypothetical protein
MRRTALLGALAALALTTPGCFVFDELDAGRALMEQHSPKNPPQPAPGAPAAAPAAAAAPAKETGLLASVQDWWTKRKVQKEAASRPGPDPTDVPVSCRIAGRQLFVRRSDCLLRGGQIL